MTKDTTAQIRKDLLRELHRYQGSERVRELMIEGLMPIVLAQVEAAKATARRDALSWAISCVSAHGGDGSPAHHALCDEYNGRAFVQSGVPVLADGTTRLDHAGHGCSVDPFRAQNDPSVTEDEERWCPNCQKHKRVDLNDECRECGAHT